MPDRQRPPTWSMGGWLALLVMFVVFMLVQAYLFAPTPVSITYSQFKAALAKGKVGDVTLTKQTITGTLATKGLEGILPKPTIEALGQAPHHRFTTVRVDDPQLVPQLEAARVNFTGKVQSNWVALLLSWVVPALVFVGVWFYLARRMGGQSGLTGLGKAKARVHVAHSTGVSFADVAGIDEAREELKEIVDFLKNPKLYQRLGGRIPKGVLLVGPPGCGKTLLAKAVAGEADVPFFSLTGSDFVEMFVGVGAARVRDMFRQAYDKAPSIIFIDELDAIGRARSTGPTVGGWDEREQTLNQLLAEMDGFDTQKGVIIMAATNRPEILDPALLRPGRFDRQVVVDRPDLKGREKILGVHTRHVKLAPGVDLSAIAARTPGFVGADLANIVNEAALHAVRERKPAVDMADFEAALDRVIAGLERKSRVLIPKEKRIVAYHEAGHALVAESREHADRVGKISIIPHGIAALGYTQQQPTEDRYLLTRTELLDRLDVLLGGRTAEELVFGDVSTGAQDDLQKATDLVRHMILQYGMSETLGLATLETPRDGRFLRIPGMATKEYSEETARAVDEEIRAVLEAAHGRVRKTLVARRSVLDALAKLLIEKEVVDRQTLVRLMSESVAAA